MFRSTAATRVAGRSPRREASLASESDGKPSHSEAARGDSFPFALRVGVALFLAILVSLAPDAVSAADWPQFRGPGQEGRASAESNPPVEWSETKNVRWRTDVPGEGWSSPVVAGDAIWLTTATDGGKSLRALRFDLATGATTLDREVFVPEKLDPKHATNSYASPTPFLDGDRVFVHFGTYGTACLDAATGDQIWTREDIRLDHEVGPGSSPVVWNDLLILTCDGTDVQFLLALDKTTGKTVWKTSRPPLDYKKGEARKAFCTPLVFEADGRVQLVSPGSDWVFAYDPSTGAEIWKVNYDGFSNVPRPVFGEGLVYIATGFPKADLLAIRPEGEGDVTKTNVVWKYSGQVPHKPSPVLREGLLHMVSERGIATCLDAKTGEELYKERIGGAFSASPVEVGGRLYFMDEEGTTTVLAAGREFRKLAENRLDEGAMASPAVVGDALIVRTISRLYRIEENPRPN